MTRDGLSRDVLSEILGAVFALAGLAMLALEMYGGGEIHRLHLWVAVGLIGGGMFFVQPRRTRELVGLVGTYVPVLGGRRPADPPAPAPAAASPVVPSAPFEAPLPPQMRGAHAPPTAAEPSPHAMHYEGIALDPADVGEPHEDPNARDAPGAL